MKFITLIILILSLPVFANLDGDISSVGRSYPRSGAITGTLGVSKILWRQDEIKYGYIRPKFELSNAGKYNSISAQVEFAPISFFILGAGQERISNHSSYADSDCSKYSCEIDINHRFLKARLMAGYKNFFVFTDLRRRFLTPADNPTHNFIDPYGQIPLNRSGDSITTLIVAAGHSIDKYKLVIASTNGKALKSDSSFSNTTLALLYQKEQLELFGAIGTYRGTDLKTAPSVVAGIKWTFKKGPGL